MGVRGEADSPLSREPDTAEVGWEVVVVVSLPREDPTRIPGSWDDDLRGKCRHITD